MHRSLLVLAALLLASPAAAQTPPTPATAPTAPVQAAPAFTARATELVGILAGTGDYGTFFTTDFQTAVPRDRFTPGTTQLAATYGAPVAVAGVTLRSPYAGTVRVRYEKATVQFGVVVDPQEPHRVSGLRILGPVAAEKSLGEVTAALDALPGITAYAFARLGDGAPNVRVQRNADKALAVGSAFKLVILAELVRATNAGERRWDDSITLDGRTLPGGVFMMRPAGTKVSLRELALQMISVSDNSATDILLFALGREKIEAMLPVLGVQRDARNTPFLSTLEAFKLKWLESGALGARYLALDDAGQRTMLANEVRTADIAPLMQMRGLPTTPSRIDSIEWFFSPADQIRIMDWLHRNTDGTGGAEARAILSRNPGVLIDRAQYTWAGYKGGSEPGVIDMTLLLRGADGGWYVAVATWNDTARALDEARFGALMTAFVGFAGAR